MPTLKAIRYSVNSNCPGLEQVVHTHHLCWLAERFGALNSNPHSWIFTSVSVGSSPRSYLLTSATVRVPVDITSKYGTEPIRYEALHFRDRRGAASLCYRNRAEITVLEWKEALNGIIFVSAQELSSSVNITQTSCFFAIAVVIREIREVKHHVYNRVTFLKKSYLWSHICSI